MEAFFIVPDSVCCSSALCSITWISFLKSSACIIFLFYYFIFHDRLDLREVYITLSPNRIIICTNWLKLTRLSLSNVGIHCFSFLIWFITTRYINPILSVSKTIYLMDAVNHVVNQLTDSDNVNTSKNDHINQWKWCL